MGILLSIQSPLGDASGRWGSNPIPYSLKQVRTANRWAADATWVRGPRYKLDAPCHSRCGTLQNTHCSMAMSAEYRSNFGNGDLSVWAKSS